MQLGNWQFRPNGLLTLGTVLLFALFLILGFWQLQRAAEKQSILQLLEQRSQTKPILISKLPQDEKAWQYQPVKFRGKFLNDLQFLLDNKIYHGKVGYEVITPIRIPKQKKLILLDRGWVPANQNRTILPMLQPVFGLQAIHGIIRQPLAGGFILKAELENTNQWPMRIQQADFVLIAKYLHQPVYPFLVLLDKSANNGYMRDWQFINGLPAKNISYAVQWFIFAGILLIIYLAFAFKRREK